MSRLRVRAGSALALICLLASAMLPARADAVPDVWFAGTRLVFDRAQLRGADIAVATGDSGLRSLLGRTGASIAYQPGQRYIVVTSADRRTITFTIGDTRVSGGGITTSAPFAPYSAGSDAYVPLVSLAHALYLLPVPDRGAIVLQPQLGALDVHTDGQTTIVTLHGATRLAFRRLTAGSDRLVLSFSGIASSLDPTRVVSTAGLNQIDVAPSGSVRNPATTVSFTLPSGAQTVLQPSSSPNDLTLAFAPAGVALRGSEIPASGYGPVAALRRSQMPSSAADSQTQMPAVAAAQSPTPAVVNAVDVAPNPGDGADVHIVVSGGADFEWHRLKDGRWYVDIRGATLALAPRDDSPNVGGVVGLRVRQFALDPVPVVRVSLTLQSQRRVDIATTSSGLTVSVGANDDPLPAKVGVGQLGGGSGYATAAVQSSAPPDLGTQPLPAPGSNPRLIVLDAGHGGSDSGADHNGVTEKNVTLDISRRLRGILASRGWTVRMTRDSDVDVYAPNDSAHDELEARCDIANRAGARLFVSIHANSFTSSSLNGTTTYYYKSVDLALARAVHRRLIAALGTKDDGVRKENFYVIHHTTMPAILIETAFISNPKRCGGADAFARVPAAHRNRHRRRRRRLQQVAAGSGAERRRGWQLTLGIFDSGLGGLTVLRDLRGLLPNEDLLYFADQAHVPYGDRSDAELRALLAANVAFLAARGAEAIVMGCNTSCAIAARYGWPDSAVPIFDLIDAAALAVAQSGARRVGVLATAATARSGAFGAAIRTRCPDLEVREAGAPALVPLVESGVRDGAVARDAVAAACTPLGEDLDALVLACTHFPLLDEAFAQVLGPSVVRIDPAHAQALRAAAWVRERNGKSTRRGRTRFVTSGPLNRFRVGLTAVLGSLNDLEDVEEYEHGEAAQRDPGDDLRDGVRLQVHP